MLDVKKGEPKTHLLTPEERDKVVRHAIDDLLGPRRPLSAATILESFSLPIDIRKPNIHDSKAEFLDELQAIEGGLEHLRAAFRALYPGQVDHDAAIRRRVDRISFAVDYFAVRAHAAEMVTTVSLLVRKMQAEAGLFWSSIWTVIDLSEALEARLSELKDQEREFWSGSSRPPNHFARTIALRVARLYAREKHARPTFGTARDGGHPSTDYCRALERIYNALGIRANVRNAARWAIGELTDDDLRSPAINALATAMQGPGPIRLGAPMDPHAQILAALQKGPDVNPF
ncbi:MAG: hypothetical protein ACKVPY_05830 [Paracoccaceae bacterium]